MWIGGDGGSDGERCATAMMGWAEGRAAMELCMKGGFSGSCAWQISESRAQVC